MPHRRDAYRLSLLILLVALLPRPAWAVEIESHLRQMLHAQDLRQTRVSVMVMDLDRGEVLAEIRADEPMIPASNMKLITTAAALDVLGPEFMFRTELGLLEVEGQAPALVVRGDGDPAFGDPTLLEAHGLTVDDLLDQWVEAAAQTGYTRFSRLIVDDRIFDRTWVHPTWPKGQLQRSYCAQVAGLNFHENCINVLLLPTTYTGQAVEVDIYPAAPFLKTINRATTGKTDQYWIDRHLGTNEFVFGGSVRNRPYEPTQRTVHDPPMFFARVLAHRMKEAGIEVDLVDRPAEDQRLAAVKPLHLVRTALPLVTQRVNQDSENMFAEALLKRMGRAVTGAPGSWDNGAAAIRMALRQRLGARSAVVRIADGSGMSRDNRVTARLVVELLQSMHEDEDPAKRKIFRDSLSRAGHSGTLKSRLGELGGDVRGKTGYLRAVSALSGYLELPSETGQGSRTIGFSLLFNDFEHPLYNGDMKDLQDKLVETIEDAVVGDAVSLGG